MEEDRGKYEAGRLVDEAFENEDEEIEVKGQETEIIGPLQKPQTSREATTVIGIKPQKVPKNITLKHIKFIPRKLDYLKVLSSSWIGINVGIHKAGTNERKYDYAEAGIVVLSDYFGSRGDLLPHEYTYIDSHDLTAKIEQLIQFGKESLEEMGKKNRNHVLFLANKKQKNMLNCLNKSFF